MNLWEQQQQERQQMYGQYQSRNTPLPLATLPTTSVSASPVKEDLTDKLLLLEEVV